MILKLNPADVKIKEGRRVVNEENLQGLMQSISEIGLLNPITVDSNYFLIAGAHRLEAMKRLHRDMIECNVVDITGLQAELAEIDENFVRNDLSTVEYGEMLLRRKEIYETLYPETKAGVAQAVGMNRVVGNNVDCKMQTTSKSFINDTAEKLGVHPCTVARQIQTAKNLTPETKEIIKDTDTKISKKAALKLSRLKPEQQKEAADLLANKKIKSVDEYVKPKQPDADSQPVPSPEPTPNPPKQFEPRVYKSITESIADLKNTEKDSTTTPDMAIMEFAAFAQGLVQNIEVYTKERYINAYFRMSEFQLRQLEYACDIISEALDPIYDLIESRQKNDKKKQAQAVK